MATLQGILARRPRPPLETPAQSILYTVVFIVVAVMVLGPVLFLIVNSFHVAGPGQPLELGLNAWRSALREPGIWRSIWNSIRIYFGTSMISWPIAITLAWIIGRTDIPKRNWIEFLFWLSFFIPGLSVVMGWILLIDPHRGLFNQAVELLPFVDRGPFNIYSYWGIVFVHLGQNAIAFKTILLVPAFRNLDATMEEASRISGGGTFATLRHVIVPLMAPAIILTALLGVVRLWQSFETEWVLGTPIGLFVFGTKIADLLRDAVPQHGQATVLATSVLLAMVPFLILQRRVTVRKRYEVITGRFRAQPTPLGRWKWPVFAVVLGIGLWVSILPVVSITFATFMKIFGYWNLTTGIFTLDHWRVVLEDPVFWLSVRNTFKVATGATILAIGLLSLIAYILVRTSFRARALLDFLSWFPQALPGLLLGLGMLWLFLTPALQFLYGTTYVLIFATVISSMTLGVQIIKANLIQLGAEMEEASIVAGASWLFTMRKVVLPLIAPILAVVGTLNFISAAKDVSNLVLLTTAENRTLAILQLDLLAVGDSPSALERGTVISVIMVLISTGVALISRAFGMRLGIR